jgi:hypothetical protein
LYGRTTQQQKNVRTFSNTISDNLPSNTTSPNPIYNPICITPNNYVPCPWPRHHNIENTYKEKESDRKYVNAWNGNMSKDECQVDLLFLQDLRKQQAMKALLE